LVEGEKMSWIRKVSGRSADTMETVRIGDQAWMTRNFASDGGGAAADPEWDEKKYGSLLSIDDAIRHAPKGWHLPTVEEWNLLSAHVMRSLDSRKLLLKEFRLVLKDGQAWLWTSTKTPSGSHGFVAGTSVHSWDEGDYGFAITSKSCDLYRCPARYVRD
jgi:uncharacterized protein (TIGR02145 family)